MVEKTLGITLDVTERQLEEFLTPTLRNSIRNKERDIRNGDPTVSYPKTFVETVSSASGDDASIDGANTTAVFESGQLICADEPLTTLDDFEDGTINTSIISFGGSTAGTGGTSQTETVEGSGLLQNTHFEDLGPGDSFTSSRSETIDLPDGSLKVEFDVASDRIEAFAQGTNTGGASASLTVNLRDLSNDTDQVVLSRTAQSQGNGDTDVASIADGRFEIREQPDGSANVIAPSGTVVNNIPNGVPANPALFIEHTATADSIGSSGEGRAESSINLEIVETAQSVFADSVVQTETVVSTASDLTDLFLDVVKSGELDSQLTVNVSADDGTNFELTDVSERRLIDLTDLTNRGSNLRLKFNLSPSSDSTGTPKLEDYVVKAFND